MQAILVVLHVLGATVWTGGHLILALGFVPGAVKARDPQVILAFESRFERIGLPALAVQVLTGIVLALRMLSEAGSDISPHVAGSLGLKVLLLVVTVGLALHARLRLIPRLAAGEGHASVRALAAHIVAVTVIAVLFVVIGVAIRLAPAGGS